MLGFVFGVQGLVFRTVRVDEKLDEMGVDGEGGGAEDQEHARQRKT